MPDPRDPPPTEEGWYALHDFRRIDWDAWREAPEREREHALEEAVEYVEAALAVEDAGDGASAFYSVLGHKADFLLLHLRPSTSHLGALERRFENTAFAEYTERATSFVSVTEASGYSERAREFFEGELDDSGLANYIAARLHPKIPDAEHVCFYPMSKRREPDQNWYDLPFDERAEHMEAHGEIGRGYGGRVVQMITGAVALDDWEWGVTLWGDDLVDVKDLLYEMRFDPSTSRFAEFGQFYVGRRIGAGDLPALLAGEPVPADGRDEPATARGERTGVESTPVHPGEGGGTEQDSEGGEKRPVPDGDATWTEEDDIESRLSLLGIRPGEEFAVDGYALVLYSSTDAQELAEEVGGLRGNFEHYDSHVLTEVRAESGQSAVVSVWDAERAADTAHGFLRELPGVSESYGGPVEGGGSPEADAAGDSTAGSDRAAEESADIREELSELDVYAGQPHGEDIYALVLYSRADLDELETAVDELGDGFDRYDTHEGTTVYDDPESDTAAVVSLWETADAADTASGYLADLPGVVGWADDEGGFATMGMFYTVRPEHREEFVGKFETVGELLGELEGHRESALLVNTDDENDMFIASRWDSREAAMEFFRSDEFASTVDWGREILADKPRHVFLA